MTKKVLCSIIAVMFLLLLFSNISYAKFSDIDNHWASAQIKKGVANGIIGGYPDGTFKPNSKISRVEFVTIINHIFNNQEKSPQHFKDVSPKDLYYEEISKAVAAGYISVYTDKTIKPNNYITRQEAAKIIAVAFGFTEEVSNSYTRFSDASTIQKWAQNSIGVLLDRGYIHGNSNGSFGPTQYMTRAQTIVVLNKAIGDIYTSKDKIYQNKTVEGNLLVRMPVLIIKNISINGDLILLQSIGNKDIVLDNVTVKGKIYIKNNNLKSITVSNGSKIGQILVDSKKAQIHIFIDNNTNIKKLTALSQVEIDINKRSLIANIILNAYTSLIISKDASVNNVMLMSKASGSVIKSKPGVKIKNDADKVTVNGVSIDKGAAFTTSDDLELLNIS